MLPRSPSTVLIIYRSRGRRDRHIYLPPPIFLSSVVVVKPSIVVKKEEEEKKGKKERKKEKRKIRSVEAKSSVLIGPISTLSYPTRRVIFARENVRLYVRFAISRFTISLFFLSFFRWLTKFCEIRAKFVLKCATEIIGIKIPLQGSGKMRILTNLILVEEKMR